MSVAQTRCGQGSDKAARVCASFVGPASRAPEYIWLRMCLILQRSSSAFCDHQILYPAIAHMLLCCFVCLCASNKGKEQNFYIKVSFEKTAKNCLCYLHSLISGAVCFPWFCCSYSHQRPIDHFFLAMLVLLTQAGRDAVALGADPLRGQGGLSGWFCPGRRACFLLCC